MSKISDWIRLAIRACGGGRKKHSVNRERSHFDRTKARKIAHHNAERKRRYKSYNAEVAAYWRGEIDAFPLKPH